MKSMTTSVSLPTLGKKKNVGVNLQNASIVMRLFSREVMGNGSYFAGYACYMMAHTTTANNARPTQNNASQRVTQ